MVLEEQWPSFASDRSAQRQKPISPFAKPVAEDPTPRKVRKTQGTALRAIEPETGTKGPSNDNADIPATNGVENLRNVQPAKGKNSRGRGGKTTKRTTRGSTTNGVRPHRNGVRGGDQASSLAAAPNPLAEKKSTLVVN